MKNILIHVRNTEALNNYIFMIENNKYNEDIKYSKEVEYSHIKNEYSELEKYLIKSITGELSNSLKCLKDIDEEF